MKVFDENGNYLGEFIADTKEKVENAFEVSWFWGLIFLLIIAPGWTLLGLVLWGLFKLIKLIVVLLFKLLIFLLRCLWWMIRLPFYMVFRHKTPIFW